MTISVNPATFVITVPKADTTLVTMTPFEIRQLNSNDFRLWLHDWADSAEGMAMPFPFRHNTTVTIDGLVYARTIEILPPYTITFEDGAWQCNITGSNNNIHSRRNLNQVAIVPGNSAGLQVVTSGSGVTAQDKTDIIDGTWAKAIEGLTAEQMMRVMLAALAGKRAGIGTATETYYGQNGTTPRITLTPDAQGNGIPTVNGTP